MTPAPAAPPSPADRFAEVRAAYRLVADLARPTPWRYWAELAGTGSLAWLTFLVACWAEPFAPLMWAAAALAVLLWYRASFMIHELTHQRPADLPGFHTAWNLAVGVPTLLPSVFYEGVHRAHHQRNTYGTARDPEYLCLKGRPWAVLGYLAAGLLVPVLLLLRFVVLVPVSWVRGRLRRRLFRYGSSYTINPRFARETTPEEERRIVRWELVILAVWAPLLTATGAGYLPGRWLVLWAAVYAAVVLANRFRMLGAHHFGTAGHPVDHLGQFHDSIDTPGGWWTELWAPLGSRYHALHHLFPNIPFHNARRAYYRLVAHLPPDAAYRRAHSSGLRHSLRALLWPGRASGS